MSNGDFAPIGYIPGVNITGLESSPVSWGGGAAANILGTTANASGSDPAATVDKSLATAPDTAPKAEYGTSGFLASVLDYANPTSTKEKKAAAEAGITSGFSTLAWSVVLVVLGLLLFSRGLGMLGEEGVGVVENLADPVKMPGIGHAVQSFKTRKVRAEAKRQSSRRYATDFPERQK